MVPSLPDGTLLIATAPSPFASTSQTSFTGLVAVDPNSGQQNTFTGSSFTLPTYIVENLSTGQLYVTDLQAFGNGAIYSVSPSGTATPIARGTSINGPNALVYMNGYLYVANEGDASGRVDDILQVDPSTGMQLGIISNGDNGQSTGTNTATTLNDTSTLDLSNLTPGGSTTPDPRKPWTSNEWAGWSVKILGGTGAGQFRTITSNTATQLTISSPWSTTPDSSSTYEIGFSVPTGMAPGPNNTIYVADEPGNFKSTDLGAIWQVNLTTGVQTLLNSGGDFDHPDDIALDGNFLLVANTGGNQDSVTGSLFEINTQTGQQSWIVTGPAGGGTGFGQFSGTDSVEVSESGTIFVGEIADGSTPAQILAVNPSTGAYTVQAMGGNLSEVEGMRTFHGMPLQTTTTVVTSSASPSVFGQGVTFTATVTPTSGSGTPTGTVQFTIDGSNFGAPVSLTGGVATSTTTTILSVGNHTIQANYSGDSSFGVSNGTLTQAVGKASTSTVVSSSLNPSVFGQSILFTATVSVQSPGSTAAAKPTGTVTFFDGSTSIGQGTLSTTSGVTTATATVSSLAAATHTITASYNGDVNFASSSRTLTQTVGKATTSTLLSSSANPSISGQSVTFTATIGVVPPGAGTPTGTVQFTIDNGSPVTANVTTAGGVTTATFTPSTLSVGTHTITATYSGVANFALSTATLTQTVSTKPATSTVVSSSINPSVFGQGVTFTATVSPSGGSGTPTGTVQFVIDGTALGSPVSLTGGVATSTAISTLSLASHNIQATYSGDSTFAGGIGTLTQTVGKASTSTVLTSSSSPSVYGQNVTFTATVGVTAPGAGTPTGSVQFAIDGTSTGSPVNVSNTGGNITAAFSTSSLTAGTHTVTASYSGDINFTSSTATTFTQTIGKASTSTVVSSSANPSVSGQSMTFTANLSVTAPGAGTPTGTIQFVVDGSPSSPVSVNTAGSVTTASFSTASLTVGTHTVVASYTGDGNFNSSASTTLTQTVAKANTSVALSASLNPSVVNQSVTFTATVAVVAPGGGIPTGTVQFMVDSQTLGSPVALTGGVATSSPISSLSVTTHNVQAVYSGDTNFAGNSGMLTQTVTKANTTTLVSSSANPSPPGQPVTFTATVGVNAPGSGTPTGTVQFVIDGIANTANVVTTAGVTTATFSTSALASGTHTVMASYSGDGNFLAGSGTLAGGETITSQPASNTVVSSSLNPSVFGQSVTFTATVTASSGSGTPTGTVQFMVDGTSAGSPVSLASGVAVSSPINTLSVNNHTVQAVYSGDSTFAGGTGTFTQTVGKASTSTLLTSSTNPSVYGQNVTFTATIGVTAPGAGTPTGSVQFIIDGSNTGGPANVSTTGGVTTASFSIANLTVGMHAVTASYTGDASFSGSGTTTLTQTVSKAATSTFVSSSANPSVPAQSVTFTATVGVTGAGSGAPTGTVQFVIDGTANNAVNVATAGGVTTATFTAASLGSGPHTVMASYSGDANFSPSTANFTQTVTSKPASTTVVSSSVNPSVFGQSVTFTATVTASGTPTGTVQFMVDGTSVGSPVSLTSGLATSGGISTLTVANHTIQAVYSGDSTFGGSSGLLTQTVGKASTGTLLTSSSSPSVYGQNVTFTAAIGVTAPGAGTPTGSVQFAIDGSNSGSPVNVTTTGGVTTALFSIANLAAGTHTVTASYTGDPSFSGSGTTTLTQTVNQANTSTAVVSSANPSSSGQTVTFTATISASGMGSAPTGTVQWLLDSTKQGNPVLVSTSGGVTTATLSLASLSNGTHTITASYSGDGNYLASNGSLQQAVNGSTGTNTTTLVSSSANPQTAGQPVSWTATVTAATGSVNFVNFETGDFSQAASHVGGALVTSPALSGTYSLHCSAAAVSPITRFGKAARPITTCLRPITASCSKTTSNPGEGGIVNFQDTSSGFKAALHLSAANQLLFYDSTGKLVATGTTTLVSGQVYAISAMIGTGSNASWQILINGTVEMSGTANLGSNNNGSLKLGGNRAYTATYYYDDVAINSQAFPGPVPTGTVQFMVDGSAYGLSVPLSDGSATSTPDSTLSAGNHTVAASYSGDSTYAPSTGSLANGETINGQTSTSSTTIVSSASPSVYGQTVTFTATVSVSGTGTPTGTVTFLDGSTSLGQGTLSTSAGISTASFSTSGLGVGTHTITASYSGDSTFSGSSGSLTQSVSQAGTTTAVVSSANPSSSGQSVTFTATISASGAGTAPTGTVQWLIDSTKMGSPVAVSTSGGVTTATLSLASLSSGTHTITASYSGDGNYQPSNANLQQTVNGSSTGTTTSTTVSSVGQSADSRAAGELDGYGDGCHGLGELCQLRDRGFQPGSQPCRRGHCHQPGSFGDVLVAAAAQRQCRQLRDSAKRHDLLQPAYGLLPLPVRDDVQPRRRRHRQFPGYQQRLQGRSASERRQPAPLLRQHRHAGGHRHHDFSLRTGLRDQCHDRHRQQCLLADPDQWQRGDERHRQPGQQ